MPEFTRAQAAAVEHNLGPALVVAGAGTGKTRVITHRIARLIEQNLALPEEIVALTFTEKAAGEMNERLDELLPYGVFGARISTFHSFCNEVLSRHSYRIGIDPNSNIIGKAEAVSLLKANFRRFTLTAYKPTQENPTSFLRDLFDFYEKMREEAISEDDILQLAQKQSNDEAGRERANELTELAHCYAVIQKLYREQRVLTYASLIAGVRELFTQSPAALEDERRTVRYLLIDEFQDTNSAQAEIAYALAGKDGNIMVVGDDDQSIYRFRGANIENILDFKKAYPQANLYTLTDNFRSGQNILDTSYRLICHNNPHRLEVVEGFSKRLISHSTADYPVRQLVYETESHEVEGVVSRIVELLQSGHPAGQIAVLARSHRALSGFEDELQLRGVATARAKQGSLYEQIGPREALFFLRFLINPKQNYNLFNLLHAFPFHLPMSVLLPLNTEARSMSKSLWQCVQESDQPAVIEVKNFLETALFAEVHQASMAILYFARQTHFENQLVEQNQYQALQNLNRFYKEVLSFEKLQHQAPILQTVAYIDDIIDSGSDTLVSEEPTDKLDAVQLLTIHASKGLEFETVFVTQMVSGRFPSADRNNGLNLPPELRDTAGEQIKYEEERRLAYVAFTRAKSRLFLTRALQYQGNKRGKKASIFLAEAFGSDESVIEDVSLTLSVTTAKKQSAASLKLELPQIISASALEAYEDDPARYLREHVYHIIDSENALTAFGTCVHKTLQAAYLALQQNQPFDLERYYTDCFSYAFYFDEVSQKEYFNDGLTSIRRYLTNFPPQPDDKYEVTVRYRHRSGITIVGKIDRKVLHPNGSYSIIDYKTSTSKKTILDVKKNLPLAIYSLAMLTSGEKVSTVELHYLRKEDGILSLQVDEKYLQNISERIDQLIESFIESYKTVKFEK